MRRSWPRTRVARGFALAAGAMDFATGLGLVCAPGLLLPLMGVAIPGGEALVFLRWVGVFVGAVGASYLWAVGRGGEARLRSVLEVTTLFRTAVGVFCTVAILRGWLSPAWTGVPLTDLALAAVQLGLLGGRGWRDE